jgi:hypothetical protein
MASSFYCNLDDRAPPGDPKKRVNSAKSKIERKKKKNYLILYRVL